MDRFFHQVLRSFSPGRGRARSVLLVCSIAAAAVVAVSGTASAQSLYSAEVSAGANAIGFGSVVQPPTRELSNNSAVRFNPLIATREAQLTHNAAAALLVGRSTASAGAEAGAIKLQTVASGSVSASDYSAPNPNASGQANASALFRDVLIFNVAGAAAGAPFTVLARFNIDAASMLNATLVTAISPSFVSASSEWRTRVSMAGDSGWLFQDDRQSGCQWVGSMVCSGATPGPVSVGFTVTHGSRVVFQMSGTARSLGGALLAGPGSAYAESVVDMGHTLAWGGVTAVVDAAGQPVGNFSMVGLGSGVDFRLPFVSAVPELSPAPLLLAGLAMLGWLTRRRLGCVLSLAPVLALAVAVPASAQTRFSGSTEAAVIASAFGQFVQPPNDRRAYTSPVPLPTQASSRYVVLDVPPETMNSLAEATSQSALGGLHLSARTRVEIFSSVGQATSGFAAAVAQGTFRDRFVLDVPGYAAGTLFTVTAGIRIDAFNALGAVLSNNSTPFYEATADWNSTVLISTGGGPNLVAQRDSQNCVRSRALVVVTCVGSGDGWRSFSFQMPNRSWAADLNMGGEARATARADLNFGGNAYITGLSDLGNTIAWGGIIGLVDSSGTHVANFSAISATSGYNFRDAYISPVPEVSPAPLMLAGLAALGWWVRRRHG